MIAQTTAYKKVVCLCGLFQSAAVILAIAAQHGGGGLGGWGVFWSVWSVVVRSSDIFLFSKCIATS